MSHFIQTDIDGPTAIVLLNRPEVLSAWHRPMRDELIDAFDRLDCDDAVRAIILTGTGRGFGAGQDLSEALQFDGQAAADWIEEWRRLYGRIRGLTKPLIAAVNGVAAGSGFQVALLADVRVAHPGVRLGQPEVDTGIPSVTGFWIMHETLGLSRTAELIVTARLMSAQEAHHAGLVHDLVPEHELMPKARELATHLGSLPPVAMRLSKQYMREATQAGFDAAMDAAARIHREAFDSGEPQRMMARFLESRAARKK